MFLFGCFVLFCFASFSSSAYLFFGGLRFAGCGLRVADWRGFYSKLGMVETDLGGFVLWGWDGGGKGRNGKGRNGNEGKGREGKGKDFEIVLITSYLF